MTAITLSQILAGKVAQYLAWDNQKQQRGARSLRFFTPAIAFLACHAREQRPKEQWRLQQEVRGQSHGDKGQQANSVPKEHRKRPVRGPRVASSFIILTSPAQFPEDKVQAHLASEPTFCCCPGSVFG